MADVVITKRKREELARVGFMFAFDKYSADCSIKFRGAKRLVKDAKHAFAHLVYKSGKV